jgi:hypothetical protein
MNKISKNKKGFAAFILVISISALMLVFISISSLEYGHFYDEVITKENRMISYYAVYSCIDQAILALSHDYFFQTSKEIKIPELNCSIDDVSGAGNSKTILTHGEYGGIKVKRKAIVIVNDNSVLLVSLE